MTSAHFRTICAFALLVGGCSDQKLKMAQQEIVTLKARSASLEMDVVKANKLVSSLQTKLASLETENKKLRESDQTYFIRASELLEQAKSPQDLNAAIEAFSDLVRKFPNSALKPDAERRIDEARTRARNIESAQSGLNDFETAFDEHQFEKAEKILRSLKNIISKDELAALRSRIEEEKNKPLDTTINRLVSKYNNNPFELIGAVDTRVTFYATFRYVNRNNKSIRAQSDGWTEGSAIDVFYEETNMESYFTDNDPKCCYNRYKVMGRIKMYENTGNLYIQADKIEAVTQ